MKHLFNNRVTFERVTEEGEGIEKIPVWQDIPELIDVPCRLQPKPGRERFIAGKDTVFASHRFFMGVPSVEITEADRIKFGSRIFEIKSIENIDEADLYYRLDLLEIK